MSKSTEEKLKDLIDVLEGPPGFIRDLNELISKHVAEAKHDYIVVFDNRFGGMYRNDPILKDRGVWQKQAEDYKKEHGVSDDKFNKQFIVRELATLNNQTKEGSHEA